MRYSITIDNVTSKKWGLKVSEAYLYAFLYTLPSWAESIKLEDGVYYWCSKGIVTSEIPLLTSKHDTIYRYFLKLQKDGLISYKKVDGKDYIQLTSKSHQWGKYIDSDKNPSKSNISSDNHELPRKIISQESENNPTYNNTIINTTTTTINISEKFISLYNSLCPDLKRALGSSPSRDKAVSDCLQQFTEIEITAALGTVSRSKFLRGGGTEGWKADFDWIFKPDNLTKIIEGKYTEEEKIKRVYSDYEKAQYVG